MLLYNQAELDQELATLESTRRYLLCRFAVLVWKNAMRAGSIMEQRWTLAVLRSTPAPLGWGHRVQQCQFALLQRELVFQQRELAFQQWELTGEDWDFPMLACNLYGAPGAMLPLRITHESPP